MLFIRQHPLASLLLLLLIAGAVLHGVTTGPLAVEWGAVFQGQAADAAVIWNLRLPRVVLGLLLGAALALSGAVLQGLFRNPLADPGLIGVSGGASLAAACLLTLWPALHHAAPIALPVASFLGGLVATLLVLALGRSGGYTRVGTLLLAGLAINALAGAGVAALAQLSTDTGLRSLTFWLFGSLGRASWAEIGWSAIPLLLCLALMASRAQALNALLLGESEARHLGIDVERLKRLLVLLMVVAVGLSVALAGIIGFVGLMVPNLLRLWLGPDHRLLLPASALGGALLLTVADTLARTLFEPIDLPIGVLTALLGAPFFLALLLQLRREPELL